MCSLLEYTTSTSQPHATGENAKKLSLDEPSGRHLRKQSEANGYSDDNSEPLNFPASSDEEHESARHNDCHGGIAADFVGDNEVVHNLRKARLDIVNWTWMDMGPENLWEDWLAGELRFARRMKDLDGLLRNYRLHAAEGRELLHDLCFLGQVSVGSTPAQVQDLFLQTFELTTHVLSEVKFFEVKLDEFAPVDPPTKISSIRTIK